MHRAQLHDPHNAFMYESVEPLWTPNEESPFNGVEVCLKDVPFAEFGVEGWPYTYGGVPALENFISQENGQITDLALEAGMVIRAIANAPELGKSNHTSNLLHGDTLNPFDRLLTAGGSSGGSAVAVRTGMVDIGFGGDGGGSLRSPAAMNGLVGHLASSQKLMQIMNSGYEFGQPGALTRDVALLAQTLNFLRKPGSEYDFGAELGQTKPSKNLVFATMGSVSLDGEMHPANAAALKELETRMIDLGYTKHPDSENLPKPFADDHAKATRHSYMRGVGISAAEGMRQIEAHTGKYPVPWRGEVGWGSWAGAQIEPVSRKHQASDDEMARESSERYHEYLKMHGLDMIIAPTITTNEGPFAKPEHLLKGAELFAASALALVGISKRFDIMKLVAEGAFPHSHSPENIWNVASTTLPVHYAESPNGRQVPVGAKIIGTKDSDATNLAIAEQVGATYGEEGFEGPAKAALDANGSEYWLAA